MNSLFRTLLTAIGIAAVAAVFPLSLHAQGFGVFSGFNISGVSDSEDDDSETPPTEITANSADIDLEQKVITLVGDVTVDDTETRITCDKMEIYLEEDAADTLVGKAEKPGESSGKKDARQDQSAEATKKNGEDKDAAGAGKQDESGGESEDEEDEDRKNIKKIVCLGNVICTKYADRNNPGEKDQIAMSEKAEFDVNKEIIVMTGAQSAPETVIPEDVYAAMVRQVRAATVAKNPVMMQGDTWMVGESFTILIKEDNRLKVRDMRFTYTGDALFSVETGEKDGEKDAGKDGAEKEGKDTERKSTTMVSANDADIDLERNLITLVGSVDVEEDASRITCGKMVIKLTEKPAGNDQGDGEKKAASDAPSAPKKNADTKKDVSEIICTGEVVFRKHAEPDDPDGEDQIAMSERAVYDAVSETILMTGEPVMIQGGNRLYGNTIEILSREDNRIRVNTAKAYITGRLLSSDDEDIPGVPSTMITAGTADFRPNEKITLSRNVEVDDGSGRITCGEMEIFMRKDSSNPLFSAGKQTRTDTADAADRDKMKNDLSKIVCSGDVVYRKEENGQERIVLSRTADYDAVNETIVMTGAHSNPKSVISAESYEDIVRVLGPGKAGEQYSVLMQGESWIAGTPITILPKEGNRLKVNDMKAALRQSSRSKTEQEAE